jgi:hypothetical protein
MTLLQSYINNIKEVKGLAHKARLEGLRNYLKSLKDTEFRNQVVLITDEQDLRILWEAGLHKRQQDFILRRIEELRRRRT